MWIQTPHGFLYNMDAVSEAWRNDSGRVFFFFTDGESCDFEASQEWWDNLEDLLLSPKLEQAIWTPPSTFKIHAESSSTDPKTPTEE